MLEQQHRSVQLALEAMEMFANPFGNAQREIPGFGIGGDGTRSVIGPNGKNHVEQQVGNLRLHLDGSGFDQIL